MRRKEPAWVPLRAVVFMHRELIAEHGGLSGPPRAGDLDAVLARPRNLYLHTSPVPSVTRLAAAYCFALARGHCFPDGNKRIALAVTDVFLRMNGLELAADEVEAAATIQSLAAGELTEDDIADWIASNTA